MHFKTVGSQPASASPPKKKNPGPANKLPVFCTEHGDILVQGSMLWTRDQVPGEPAQILLADGLVDGGAAPDTLPVVVGGVRPPVRLHLHVPKSKGFNILNYDK